ncbi:MAG: RNA polymerase sigma-54 factor [Chloroflexota bacterium]|nr:RNA polymerase sigma-54 factor [Chloroflexota bacterium]
MESGFELSHEMRTWVSPSLIEANYILSLSRQELQAVVAAEMDANPALDMDERQTCPLCGNVLDGTFCPVCLVSQRHDADPENYEDFPETLANSVQGREDGDDFDPMTLIADDIGLREQILADARTVLEPGEYPIAEYLIDAIDDRGFLAVDVAELAEMTKRPAEEIEAIVEVIQDVAPVGVGARNLQECLLLQLRFLIEGGHPVPPHVERIIATHLPEFGAHKYGQIARDLGLTAEEVEAAREFIRTYLNPFPLQTQQARSWRTPTRSPYVAPDVIISLKDDVLHVEVVETKHFHLRLSPIYDRLSGEIGRRKPAAATGNGATASPNGNGHANGQGSAAALAQTRPLSLALTTDGERTHVRQYSSRAKLFISNIHQRRETLLKISKCICELQENFLRGGVRELRPLTRAVVAQQVGVHESTVSRATANKYVMLPSRRVIPFSDFFTPSLSTKDVIKELIEREAKKGEPLTDRRICDLLLEQGIRIARRTVAKYRAELGILPSTMR